MKKVVVIGGGITGLSIMHYLQKIKNKKQVDLDLTLVEKNEYLGGKIHTVEKNGEFLIETGADSIVARHESVMPLIKDLRLEDQVVYNSTGISYIYTNNELHAIPAETVFGIPVNEESLFSSTLVSEAGKKEALKDFETKNEHFTKEDSIGTFLKAFLGEELVDKQIAPVLSGVYSGELDKLTIGSTLPYLLDYKNKYGSIMKGLNENRDKFLGAAKKKFISFKGGLSTIIDQFENELKEVTILKGAATENIERSEELYKVQLSNGQTLSANYVIFATPHDVTQTILKNADLDTEFNKLKNSSLISIYLGFDIPDQELPADGTGFIVSENSDIHCDACTWTSRKWEHTSEKNNLLVRLFYKSSNPSYTTMKDMDENGLLEVALSDIEKSLGITGQPKVVEVTNWNNLMPNYHIQHGTAVKSLEQKFMEIYPNVLLAGCSYYGVGIGACIKNGKEIAESIGEQIQ